MELFYGDPLLSLNVLDNHKIASSASKEPVSQFEAQISLNNDVINVLNILERKESW